MRSYPPVAAFSAGLIILNYNTSQAVIDLYRQIGTLRRDLACSPIFLVIDNASRPEETARLGAFFANRPDVHLILSPTNGGYACGNNLGLKKAVELGLEYCIIANSDIAFLTVDFLEQLVQAARTLPNCGLIGPRVVLPDGRPQGPLPETGVLNGVIPWPSARCDQTSSVYATVGCCLFGPTTVFNLLGFLDENTFLYREEIILAERLRQHGLFWYYLPAVVVRHDHVRKMAATKTILLHKKFEAESTVYYFRHYRHRSAFAVLTYRTLLAAKVGVVLVLSFVSRTVARCTHTQRLV